MKRVVHFTLGFLPFWALGFLLSGCQSSGDLREDVQTLVTDPVSANHQQRLDDLESAYLSKKISYTEYQEKKKAEDERFSKDVTQHGSVIHENDRPAQ